MRSGQASRQPNDAWNTCEALGLSPSYQEFKMIEELFPMAGIAPSVFLPLHQDLSDFSCLKYLNRATSSRAPVVSIKGSWIEVSIIKRIDWESLRVSLIVHNKPSLNFPGAYQESGHNQERIGAIWSVTSWAARRNYNQKSVDWQFGGTDARVY